MGAVSERAFPVPGALGFVVSHFVLQLSDPKEWLYSAEALNHSTVSSRAACMLGTMTGKNWCTFVPICSWHGSSTA